MAQHYGQEVIFKPVQPPMDVSNYMKEMGIEWWGGYKVVQQSTMRDPTLGSDMGMNTVGAVLTPWD